MLYTRLTFWLQISLCSDFFIQSKLIIILPFRVLPPTGLKKKTDVTIDPDDCNESSSNIVGDRLANNAHKLLRSMKQLLAREKTVNITGTGSSSCSSQIAG